MTSKTKSRTASPKPSTTAKATSTKKPAAAKRTAKRPSTKKAIPQANPASLTLAQVAAGYLAHIEKVGKSPSTIASYRADLGVAFRHFGRDNAAGAITPAQVAEFNECDTVTKTRTGKPKAKPGVDKTRRVLRLALAWAEQASLIEKAPIPAPAAKS